MLRHAVQSGEPCPRVQIIVEDLDTFPAEAARAMLLGASKPLLSRFRLSYYTLLNLTKRRVRALLLARFPPRSGSPPCPLLLTLAKRRVRVLFLFPAPRASV